MSEEHGYNGGSGELSAPTARTERPIEFDQLFALLSAGPRRHALYCVAETSAATLSTNALIEEVVALERQTGCGATSRDELELALRHTHLPKLSDADVIDYDPNQSIVAYRGGRRVDRWIDRAKDAELDPTSD